jgi:hypothetical protein
MNIPSDTSPDIAQLQFELLRKASPRARGAAVVELTDFGRGNARRAIAAANPHLTRDEQDAVYAEIQYGKELADELREYFEAPSPRCGSFHWETGHAFGHSPCSRSICSCWPTTTLIVKPCGECSAE